VISFLIHEGNDRVVFAFRVVRFHYTFEIRPSRVVDVFQHLPGHVLLPRRALGAHRTYDLGQQIGFDLSAFGRARSFAQETPDVRRDQLVVLQQTAHVQVIVTGNVRPGGRVERRRRRRRLSAGGAADRRELQRHQDDRGEQTRALTSEADEDFGQRRGIHVGGTVARATEGREIGARPLSLTPTE